MLFWMEKHDIFNDILIFLRYDHTFTFKFINVPYGLRYINIWSTCDILRAQSIRTNYSNDPTHNCLNITVIGIMRKQRWMATYFTDCPMSPPPKVFLPSKTWESIFRHRNLVGKTKCYAHNVIAETPPFNIYSIISNYST